MLAMPLTFAFLSFSTPALAEALRFVPDVSDILLFAFALVSLTISGTGGAFSFSKAFRYTSSGVKLGMGRKYQSGTPHIPIENLLVCSKQFVIQFLRNVLRNYVASCSHACDYTRLSF